MADTKDLQIQQGKTFSLVLRWETEPCVYRTITAIQQTAPARLTVTGHGFPDGWRCAVTNVKGMTEINAEANNLRDKDYNPITVIDANTVEINAINAAGFKAYVSSGILQGNTPVNLTGYTARMAIKQKAGTYNRLRCTSGGTSGIDKPTAEGVDGSVVWVLDTSTETNTTHYWRKETVYAVGNVVDLEDLFFLCTENSGIAFNTSLHTITLTISAKDTAAFTWKSGGYDLEMVSASGVVTPLLTGKVAVSKEVTT